MSESATYSVIIEGELLSGFEPDQVHQAFSALFKITPEKSSKLLEGKRVLKKEIDLNTARLYKKRLENIGIKVRLEEKLQQTSTTDSLSLVPTDEEIEAKNSAADTVTEPVNTFFCPKCNTQQAKDTEQCSHCGVYMHKVMPQRDTPSPSAASQVIEEKRFIQTETETEAEAFTSKSLGAGAAAALFGAIIWNVIANLSGFEFGFIAWAIGGGIGFAVAVTGGRGEKAGITCGVLALLAIMGGKYLFYSDIKDELHDMMTESKVLAQAYYDTEMKAVVDYSPAMDDESLRQFMIDYEYSDNYASSEVTLEEINAFKEEVEPRLTEFTYSQPNFDEWYEVTIDNTFEDISILDAVTESLGIMDLLFLLLGIGTAFRLGRGES